MAAKCASKTLFVGNLHASLEESDLLEIFRPFGRIVECCKRWCHYGFIQFATEDEAKLAFNNLNGSRVRCRPMRIEFQRKKIRNLAALLEAEAASKMNKQERTSPKGLYCNSDAENVSPTPSPSYLKFEKILASDSFVQFAPKMTTNDTLTNNYQIFGSSQSFSTKQQLDGNQFLSPFNMDLASENGFIKKNSMNYSINNLNNNASLSSANIQPLGTRSLNSMNIVKNSNFDQLPINTNSNSDFGCLLARDLATNLLLSSSASNTISSDPTDQLNYIKTINSSNDENAIDIDNKSTAWFNYLLDKAAQYPSKPSRKNADSYHSLSSASSPLSHGNTSPNSNSQFNRTNQDNSIMIYRSLNSSNTIFVQPTDILEPLEIGDFNEYKLFPSSSEEFYTMSSPNKDIKSTGDLYNKFNQMIKCHNNLDYFSKELDILVELTPPSSVSLSSSSSVQSSSSSPTSIISRKSIRRPILQQ